MSNGYGDNAGLATLGGGRKPSVAGLISERAIESGADEMEFRLDGVRCWQRPTGCEMLTHHG